MTPIVLCIVLIFIFAVFAMICLYKNEPMAAAWGFIISIIITIILIGSVKEYYNEDEDEDEIEIENIEEMEEPNVLYDVTDFRVDTNVVVNGADTTKTYVITYLN